jgi:Fe2+ transport system protein B
METCLDSSPASNANGAADSGRPALDRRAMDALVNAVDARLREQGAQIDRRLADLEAALALEINALREQADAFAGRSDTSLELAQKQWNEQTLALWQQRKEDLASLRQEIAEFQQKFAAEIATAVEKEVSEKLEATAANMRTLVETAATARIDPLVGKLDARNAEFAAMRQEVTSLSQRTIESERTVLEIALGMSEWFRELAARMCAPRPASLQSPMRADGGLAPKR